MASEKTSIAARMYIALRREAKRSIDVEWLQKNDEYARVIVTIARQHSQELIELADHLEALLPEPPMPIVAPEVNYPALASSATADISERYIGRLR